MAKEGSATTFKTKIHRNKLAHYRRIRKRRLIEMLDENDSSKTAEELSYLDPAIRLLYFIHLMQTDEEE